MITLGTDSEAFFVDGNGSIVSSIGLIGGDKDTPRLTSRGNLQEDNILAEFAINPASNIHEWFMSIKQTMIDLRAVHEFELRSSAIVPDSALVHPKAHVFGCEPDFDAYTGEMNKVDSSKAGNLRTAGGHIHVGFKTQWGNAAAELAQWMDIKMGLPSVLLDKDKQRKALYGHAGAHRPKPYGVEYRVLSNFWLKSDELIMWAWSAANEAYKEFCNDPVPDDLKQLVRNAINQQDESMARSLIKDLGVYMP